MGAPLVERFFTKVEIGRGCWLWTGAIEGSGYGVLDTHKRTATRAHRASWVIAYGPIPLGKSVLHHCDVRRCVRPTHLFVGSQADNVRDMHAKGRGRSPAGEANPNSKLSNEDVGEIRRLCRNGGMARCEVAKLFGVSPSLVSHIANRRIWRHVP